ncbi:MAG TPA: TetR family transcriptional regulator [Candidatus Eisenbacteria bacterium]|nr:TetR family transcriptional regulator [Candidatus Eisenbacteria bacterium]
MATLATRRVTRELPQADDVRARILDAAEAVFGQRGYAGATTREIAERAGIGKRMLFYYFPTKDAVYRAVLERVITGLVAIYEQTREQPGPIGLGDAIEGITRFTARNLPGMKVWLREIIDGGPHLDELTRTYIVPLYQRAGEGVAGNMASGVFRKSDPVHLMVNVGGVTLFYFLIAPMLRIIWNRDPLDATTVGERAAAARDCLLHGLAGPAGPKETSS